MSHIGLSKLLYNSGLLIISLLFIMLLISSPFVTMFNGFSPFASATGDTCDVEVVQVYSTSEESSESLSLPLGEYDLSQLYKTTYDGDGKTYVAQVVVEKFPIMRTIVYRSNIEPNLVYVDQVQQGSQYIIKDSAEVDMFIEWNNLGTWSTSSAPTV